MSPRRTAQTTAMAASMATSLHHGCSWAGAFQLTGGSGEGRAPAAQTRSCAPAPSAALLPASAARWRWWWLPRPGEHQRQRQEAIIGSVVAHRDRRELRRGQEPVAVEPQVSCAYRRADRPCGSFFGQFDLFATSLVEDLAFSDRVDLAALLVAHRISLGRSGRDYWLVPSTARQHPCPSCV